MNAAEIAAKLSKAQREALLALSAEYQAGPYPSRWEVKTPRVWKSLIDRQVAYGSGALSSWRSKPDRAVLNSAGLAVRAILQAKEPTDGA